MSEMLNTTPVKRSGSNLTLAALLMMSGLLLSKLTGMLREILVPYVFGGVSYITDAYNIGFNIPDLFYQLLIGGAIQAAITPTLAAALEKRKEKEGWRSVSILINLTSVIVIVAVLIGELIAPYIIPLLYQSPKITPAALTLAVSVTQALFPQVFFMMLAALCIGILNAYKKFGSTSFGPAIYNVCFILVMVFLATKDATGPVRVASGVMLATCFYFVMQFWLARKEFKHFSLSFDYRDSGFQRLLKLAVPTLISGSIVQINMIILNSFATQYGESTVSLLRNASSTWQLPYGIFAIAIGNVMLPSLSGLHAVRDYEGSRRLFGRSLRSALFMIIPSAGLFLAMQPDVIRAIFQWSPVYTEQNVTLAASMLSWYCLAMVAQTIIFIVNQAFYARKMTKIALFNGILTLVLNVLLCLLLSVVNPGDAGNLSFSYTLTSFISLTFLYTLYCKTLPAAAPYRMWPFIAKSLLCATALIMVTLGLSAIPIALDAKIFQLLWLAGRMLIGIAIYIGIAYALKMPEAEKIVKKITGWILKLFRRN